MSADRADTRGDAAIRVLLRSFSARTGRWRTPTGEAWQPALAIEAVLLAYKRSRASPLLNVVEKSFARYRGRRSRFFDDDGWYLNVWLSAYEVTGDPKYVAEARSMFETMIHGWDDHCGGGLWWSADRTYKNAITNELFLLAAARLARRTDEPRYRSWALRAWAWFDASGLINADDLVNDGLDGSCTNNGQPTWTYNQGVILGALVELSRLTGERTYLEQAGRIANAAMSLLVHTGHRVLREAVEIAENRDSHAFKGVLAQGLARLYAADPEANQNMFTFLRANAEAVWREGKGAFGLSWLGGTDLDQSWALGAGLGSGRGRTPGPGRGSGQGRGPGPDPVNAATQMSAALLLNAVDLLESGPARTSARHGESGRGEDFGSPAIKGTRIEAEQVERIGVGLEAKHPGFTGSGYVAGWNRVGQTVAFFVEDGMDRAVRFEDGIADRSENRVENASKNGGEKTSADWRTFTIRYAAGAGDAYRSFRVGGVSASTHVLFVGTGRWDAYSTVSLDLRVGPGERVEIGIDRPRGDGNFLNLDSITIRSRGTV